MGDETSLKACLSKITLPIKCGNAQLTFTGLPFMADATSIFLVLKF